MRERYSHDQAADEAETLRRKVESGKADGYSHAELQLDYETSEKAREEFRRISDILADLNNYSDLRADEKRGYLEQLENKSELWEKTFRHYLSTFSYCPSPGLIAIQR